METEDKNTAMEDDVAVDDNDQTKIVEQDVHAVSEDFLTKIEELSPKAQKLLENINSALVGQPQAARLTVICLLSGGHALIEDVPGVGKTLLAKSLALSVHSKSQAQYHIVTSSRTAAARRA